MLIKSVLKTTHKKSDDVLINWYITDNITNMNKRKTLMKYMFNVEKPYVINV